MMRSVSMSLPRRGTARPVTVSMMAAGACMLWPLFRKVEEGARVGDLAVEGGGDGHDRAHQQGAPGRRALAALEVAVARGRADFTVLEFVRVHGQAHRATGLAPLEARLGEDLVQAHFLGV